MLLWKIDIFSQRQYGILAISTVILTECKSLLCRQQLFGDRQGIIFQRLVFFDVLEEQGQSRNKYHYFYHR